MGDPPGTDLDDRDGTLRGVQLRAWAFGSLHAALVVAVGVGTVYAAGALGDLLAGLSTAVGLLVYGLLWATSLVAARRVLARAPPSSARVRSVLSAAAAWGGIAGVAFLLELLAVAVVGLALRGSLTVPTFDGDVVGLFAPLAVLGVGAALALLVGSVVGVLLAVVDLVVVRVVGDTQRDPGASVGR
jgi:hypothetical protein